MDFRTSPTITLSWIKGTLAVSIRRNISVIGARKGREKSWNWIFYSIILVWRVPVGWRPDVQLRQRQSHRHRKGRGCIAWYEERFQLGSRGRIEPSDNGLVPCLHDRQSHCRWLFLRSCFQTKFNYWAFACTSLQRHAHFSLQYIRTRVPVAHWLTSHYSLALPYPPFQRGTTTYILLSLVSFARAFIVLRIFPEYRYRCVVIDGGRAFEQIVEANGRPFFFANNNLLWRFPKRKLPFGNWKFTENTPVYHESPVDDGEKERPLTLQLII